MPGRISSFFGGDWITPRLTTKTLEAEASVSRPSRNRMVSTASASEESWRRSTLPMSEIDLMSQRSQRLSSAITARDKRWLRCDIKSISLIGNVLLRQLSSEADAVETILFRDGRLTEASASNVFVVKRGVIQSPPKNELILPGITYDVVVELARANALPLEFREIAEAEVRAADELWVTSSSKEVLAVVRLDGAAVGDGRPGPAFRRMYRLYQDFKHKVMRAGRRESLPA